jgi:hypothetical protein
MSAYETTLAAALALTPAERLNLILLLGESLRKPLDAPKPRKPRAAKAAKEGEEAKAPNAWQAGLTVVRAYLKAHNLKGSLAMKLGKELKERKELKALGSWPNPTEEEIAEAVEAVPEDERASKASAGSKASGSKGSKRSAKLELPEGLPITVKELTAEQKELYDALSEEDQKTYDAEVAKRRARAEKAKATRAAKKATKEESAAKEPTAKEPKAAAAGGGSAAKAVADEFESDSESEEETEAPEIKPWKGDVGKGEQEFDRLDFEGVSYLWETKKGVRKYVGALKTKKDGSYKVDKTVAEPELDEE